MPRIDSLLRLISERGASDLHMASGNQARLRQDGVLLSFQGDPLKETDVRGLLLEIMPERAREDLQQHHQADFAYELEGVARYRINAFRHVGGLGMVARVVPGEVLTLEQLGLPEVLGALCRRRSGLILVTGPTGSGKSTTMGAMVDRINKERHGHVITIEQPIELVHQPQHCLITQREVGMHCDSFQEALRSALREDPDVIVVGEMRDLETMRLAVTAAEMGTLVLGTLHTVGAVATVDRIVNAFPAEEQSYIRSMLSTSLIAVVSQLLLQKQGGGRVAMNEILLSTPAAGNLVREGKLDQLSHVLETGAGMGMQTFDAALRKLRTAGLITEETAKAYARGLLHGDPGSPEPAEAPAPPAGGV